MEAIFRHGFDRALWPLMVLAGGGLLVGLIAFGSVLRRSFGRARGRGRAGCTGNLMLLLVGVASLAIAAAAGFLLGALRGFAVFNQKTWVAEIQCIETGPGKLLLFYAPIVSGKPVSDPQKYELSGDQWSIGADILRWRPWATMLGLKTVYKVTRVEGRFLSARDASGKPLTAYDIEGGTSEWWRRMYRHHDQLPFKPLVEAVYGNAVYQFPDRKVFYDLYVTTSGVMAEKRGVVGVPATP